MCDCSKGGCRPANWRKYDECFALMGFYEIMEACVLGFDVLANLFFCFDDYWNR